MEVYNFRNIRFVLYFKAFDETFFNTNFVNHVEIYEIVLHDTEIPTVYMSDTKPIGVDDPNIREEASQLLSSAVQINSLLNMKCPTYNER